MTMAVYAPLARGARNGLPVRFYRYQGTGADTLTPEIDAMPLELFSERSDRSHHLLRPRDLKPCGTPAAYRRHVRREGTPVTCQECVDAEARRNAEARERRSA